MTSGTEPKKTKRKPNPGDVFVIKPWEDEQKYFYSKVIKTNIENESSIYKGSNLVYVYKNCTEEIEDPNKLELNELLIAPILLWNKGWMSGYFNTIGFVPVTEEELSLDFGLQHITTKKYLNVHGKPLDHEPKYKGDYNIVIHNAIDYFIRKAFEDKKSGVEEV